MKTKMFKIALILLILTGSFSSCGKRSESGSEVPYKSCHCEEDNPLMAFKFLKEEAYLFRDSIPMQMVEKINTILYDETHKTVCWILYDSKYDYFGITVGNYGEYSMLGGGQICNFPDFAREWVIPKNGCKVVIEGDMYSSCNCLGVANKYCFDLILTNIKRK